MKSTLYILILTVLLLSFSGQVFSREVPTWHLESTRLANMSFAVGEQVNNTGDYIARISSTGEIINTVDLSIEKGPYAFWGVRYFPWLNYTIIYVPIREGYEPLPCPASAALTLFRYDATTHIFDYICIETVPTAWDITGGFMPVGSQAARSPQDRNLLLANERFLIDLQNTSVTDLQSVLSTQLDRSHMEEWVAHRSILWDSQTWYPVARVLADIAEGDPFTGVTGQTLKICAMASLDCEPIVRVENYIHGGLSDFTVSSDGHTLLWSVIEYPIDQPIYRGGAIGIAIDVVAYATAMQTGATTQIFRLSDDSTVSTSDTTVWSPNGQTLAISVEDLTSTQLPRPRFVMLAQFTALTNSAQLQGRFNAWRRK
jgi:hypothetical protein